MVDLKQVLVELEILTGKLREDFGSNLVHNKSVEALRLFEKLSQKKFTESDLVPWSTWRHVKTNSLYVVLGIALCSTNGPREHKEKSVVYVSLTHGRLCYREVSEFLDGRFVPEKESAA